MSDSVRVCAPICGMPTDFSGLPVARSSTQIWPALAPNTTAGTYEWCGSGNSISVGCMARRNHKDSCEPSGAPISRGPWWHRAPAAKRRIFGRSAGAATEIDGGASYRDEHHAGSRIINYGQDRLGPPA
jgi:hypothetical protein